MKVEDAMHCGMASRSSINLGTFDDEVGKLSSINAYSKCAQILLFYCVLLSIVLH